MPGESPLSVIVPVHNRADLAAQCLAALRRWTTPLEIVVIDDGSSDPGVASLRRAGLAHHWLCNETAQGFSAAVNRGLAQATGDLLLLLNSDAEVTGTGDQALRAAFASPTADGSATSVAGSSGAPRTPGAVAARLVYPDGRPQWSGGAFPSRLWLFALASGLGRGARFRLRQAPPSGFAGGLVDWAPGAALAISREAFAAVGPFDESYRHYAQDLDYCQRLGAAGFSVRVLADWVVVHHLGGSLATLAGRGASDESAASDASDKSDESETSASRRRSTAGSGFDGQRLDLLWLDLLHWARRYRRPAWVRQARRRLIFGGRLRLLRLRWSARRDAAQIGAVMAAIAAVSAARDAEAGRSAPGPR